MHTALVALVAVLIASSATVAVAQETTTTHTVEGRTLACTTTVEGATQTSRCDEVNGPYRSICVGPLPEQGTGGVADETCGDNYGHSWDPSVTAAPPLPPAVQPPSLAAPAVPPACVGVIGFKPLDDLLAPVVGGCGP